MKKSLAVIITAALAVVFAMGCEKGQAPAANPAATKTPAPAAPAAPVIQAPSQEVRGVTSGGQSLAGVLDEMDKELDRLQAQADVMSRKPKLDESKVNTFNLAGAASRGPENAKLTMVVFSDFQCPFCSRFAMGSKELLAKFPDDLRLVYMAFPLNSKCNTAMTREMHPQACAAAEAAMSALAQGKFWEMHDWLFENQRTLSPESIEAAAPSLGLDAAAIKDAIDTEKYKSQIEAQAQQLLATGSARGTPTAFINGMLVENARWDDVNSVAEFIGGLLHPEAQQQPPAAATVPNAGSLAPAKVVLDDGTLLEDRLNALKERLSKISLRPEATAPQQPKVPDPNRVYSFNLTTSPSQGASDAPITIVTFGDLLSPQYTQIAGELKEILAQYPGKVRWVFKNPPRVGSPGSLAAHEAALAANAQGKFWPMHDLIAQHQGNLTQDELRKYAQQIGLDMAKYDDDMQKHPYRQALIEDIKEADAASVSMPPALFVNGKYQPDTRKEALIAAIQTIIGQGGTK